jgi:hypothetical protein
MTAIKSQHSRVFEQLLRDRRQELLEAMAGGLDVNIYWRLVGQVQGIDDAVKYSEEADFKISGDEPDVGA